MRDPLAEVRGLKVGYPDRAGWTLDGVDLEVAEGEHLLVVGASGSGKSTLLHVLAGLVPSAFDADVEGDVRVGAHDPTATPVPVLSRTLGLLRQDPISQVALPLVEDELAFVLENRATAPERISSLVDGALEQVGLPHLRGRRTSTLSGGELQRVALAATLLSEPRLLVLDEPTAMLDPAAAHEVGDLLADSGGPATVVVEHRLEDLPRLPDRVLLLDQRGRVRAVGPTPEVLAEHARWLVGTGAWLPLGVELGLVTEGRVLPADVTRSDDDLLSGAAPLLRQLMTQDAPTGRPPGEVLLAARGATFLADGDGPPLVEQLDLDLRAGEVTAIIGTNGSGKTSLLLGLAGFLPRAQGEVDSASVGMVFQHPEHQLLGRSVTEDIALSLSGGRRRRAAGEDPRVASAVARFGLHGLEAADPFRLSGGQKRRLSIASMSVAGHRVLLLDEPTFGQDRTSSRQVEDAIASLAAEGRAVALTTHDLRMAARLADRIVVVHDGRAVACGTPDEVLADRALLQRTGLRLPSLLAWWSREARDRPVRGLLTALDAAVAGPAAVAVAP